MTSPCHPGSTSGSSSPYSPASPSYEDAQPSTSSAGVSAPSCSYALGAGAASTSTAQATDSAARACLKRSRSENTSESSEPKKKKSKTKHCDEPSSAASSPSQKHKISSPTPTKAKRPRRTNLSRGDTWQVANRYTGVAFHPLRGRINAKFLKKLQQELQTAQQSLETVDVSLGLALQEVNTDIDSANPPIVMLRRLGNKQSRLGWDKLVKAFSRLETQANNTSGPLGRPFAERAARWLAYLFKLLHPRTRARTIISGMSFTRLCAQALSAQGATLTADNPVRPMPGGNGSCFLSHEDFEQARHEDPQFQSLDSEPAVCFLRFSHSSEADTPDAGHHTVDFDDTTNETQ